MRLLACLSLIPALLWSPFALASGAPPTSPTRSRWLPTLLVPPKTGKAVPAEWDSLAQIEDLNHWAVSESLATVLVKRLEATFPTDSLALAHALMYEAN